MILTEQIIKKIGRQYWRDSQYVSWDSSLSRFSCFYVTTDEVYAFHYSYEKDQDVSTAGYLTEYLLRKSVNLFNARSKKDRQLLEDYIRVRRNIAFEIRDIDSLTYLDWLKLGNNQREALIEALKYLGYDGFVNFESDNFIVHQNSKNSLYQLTGIGFFDQKSLIEGRIYKGYEEIKQLPKIKEAQENEKKWISEWLVDHKDIYLKSKRMCINFLYNWIPNIKLILSFEDLKDFVENLSLADLQENISKIRKMLKKNGRKSDAWIFL